MSLPVLAGTDGETRAGNYFVSNYPPFSLWSREHAPGFVERLDRGDAGGRPLGLYVHIPFCRKRCHFCYFKVYTDRSRQDIDRYVDAVIAEMARVAERPLVGGRPLRFVYFGGGTPSYLSERQLERLFDGLKGVIPWEGAEEVAFECEPGTLSPSKLEVLRGHGVNRLSLGIENFDDGLLELNNRAHRSKQAYMAYGWAKDAGFPQVNIDLIAGMLGETDENWARNIAETRRLAPEAVTIYQMEIPYNTTIYRRMREDGTEAAPVADWGTKRRWVSEAMDALEADGYGISSAYTAVRDPDAIRFVYRDALWAGADMLGVGVSSFGHMGGVHYQNEPDIVPYVDRVEAGELPVSRALPITEEEAMIRRWVLQLKLGRVSRRPFVDDFGVDPFHRWEDVLDRYRAEGHMAIDGDELTVSRAALLRIDSLLHAFMRPEHRGVRYA